MSGYYGTAVLVGGDGAIGPRPAPYDGLWCEEGACPLPECVECRKENVEQ